MDLYLTKFVNRIPITIICDTQRAIVLDQLSYQGGARIVYLSQHQAAMSRRYAWNKTVDS